MRVHSASETGDILGTLLEDYGSLISKSLLAIEKEGKGALVYLVQHDKGGLISKLSHLKQLNDEGRPEKFELHSPLGKKDFGVGAQIVRDLGISKIRL
ncbi:MAG: GTP cyclohydrolase II, partial [Bacteroidota bacterium]